MDMFKILCRRIGCHGFVLVTVVGANLGKNAFHSLAYQAVAPKQLLEQAPRIKDWRMLYVCND